jgi:superfamily I DNA/RNA helicase/RecB family exonuclease
VHGTTLSVARPIVNDVTDPDPRLDASQRAVLRCDPAESVLVIGAPGTGKTTTLVELVADRVHDKGMPAESVLALTFDRASATRLRDRLELRVGEAVNGPLARTVTSFAFDIVAEVPASDGAPPTLLTGAEQDATVAALLAGQVEDAAGPEWPEPLGEPARSTRAFRTELRELMMRATERGIGTRRMRALAVQEHRPQWAAAAEFIDEYRATLALRDAGRLDAAELMRAAVAALHRGEVGGSVSRLRLVVVDDLQEATELGLALLDALRERGVPVVAFGDPDVASTVFRGGTADAVARFGRGLPTLVLGAAHRQGSSLRDLTERITARIGTAGVTGHRSAVSAGVDETDAVCTLEASTPAREWAGIARLLRERHLLDGVPWSALAVVARSGALVESAARALAAAEVPVRTASRPVALRDDPTARALLDLLACAVGRTELTAQTATALLLGPFGGLDRLELRRLRMTLRAEEVAGGGDRSSDELLVEVVEKPGRLVTIDHRSARAADRLARALERVRLGAAAGLGTDELLWTVWEGTNTGTHWRQAALGHGVEAAEANRRLDGVVALFTAAKRFGEREPDSPPAVFLTRMLDADVPEDTLAPTAHTDAVLVTTPSGVVGQEFDTVVVAGLQDGLWPDMRVRGTLLGADDLVRAAAGDRGVVLDERRLVLADELRLFALSVSRARRRVVLAACSDEDEAPSALFHLAPPEALRLDAGAPALSLRALTGRLRRELTRRGAREGERRQAASALVELAGAGVPLAHPDEWHGLAAASSQAPYYDAEETVPVSPSKIEAIEQSPLDWLIDEVAGSTTSTTMGIGTIVHWAMEHAEGPQLEALQQAVESRWRELAFEARWVGERERRAVRRLVAGVSEYLLDAQRAGVRLVGAERRFTLDTGRAQVHGVIDRIEADTGGGITIVDLKTGRPETNSDTLAAMPQLGIYQLAYASGQLDEVCAPFAPHHGAGAKLLFVREGVRGKAYREGVQPALDSEGLDAFRERIELAVDAIAVSVFSGTADVRERGGQVSVHRLHRVREVTSD